MRARFAHCLVTFALIAAVGGHWAMLQSVAWVGMVIRYAQEAPLLAALEKTFDGDHPCALCRFVDQGRKSEKKSDILKVETKLDLWMPHAPELLFPPPPFEHIATRHAPGRIRFESPPTPPPRCA